MKYLILIIALLSISKVFAQQSPAVSTTVTPTMSSTVDQSGPIMVNGIAVVVNNEVITKQELQERIHRIERRLQSQGVALPPRAELQKQLIEQLIVERAELQLARDNGLRVDDMLLDRAILRIAEQNKITPQTLRDQVEKEGMSYAQFRESVRDDIMLQRIQEREVDSKVQVTEAEVDNYLAAQKENKEQTREVELSQILIRSPESASPETLTQLRARAESVLQKIQSGADFSQLAATYSDSSEGLKGGSLGWRQEDRYPQLFIDAIAGLQVGQTTGLIKSANGFHILKLMGRRANTQDAAVIPQAHVRLIFIRVTPTLTHEQAKHKLLGFKQRLENGGAHFNQLAKQFSNDPSASKGGDLGWIYPGDVPEFDPVINILKEGQISDPIAVSQGLSIIQLVGRKHDEISQERQRLLARQTIRARKADEAMLYWVRKLSARAYVEIRSDDNQLK